MLSRLAIAIALLMLSLTHASSAQVDAPPPEGPAPENVLAYVTPEKAYVSWTPVVVPGSTVTYNVYGFDGNRKVLLLEDVPSWEVTVEVEAGHGTYGVSAVVDGEEGGIVAACTISIQLRPPYIRAVNCREP